jgi:PPP family 3-phenylpropionic acid transporter
VLAEITAFWWMPRILARVSLAQLLRFGLLMAALRFAVIAAWPDSPPAIAAMQLFHAFTLRTCK